MPFKKIAQDVNKDKLSPLNVTCTSSKCEDNLHSYWQKPRRKKIVNQEELWGKVFQKGSCWACRIDLVDWPRVHSKNLSDVIYTFDMLNTELVRYVYWHTEIDHKAFCDALEKGRLNLRFDAEELLRKNVANAKNPRWEGTQTPKKGDLIYYAQHATACCCRKCIEYWYNIPRGIQLNDKQINYFVELIMLYVSARMPKLQEDGSQVPPIRSNGKLLFTAATQKLVQSSPQLNHQEAQDQKIFEGDEYFVPLGEALPV